MNTLAGFLFLSNFFNMTILACLFSYKGLILLILEFRFSPLLLCLLWHLNTFTEDLSAVSFNFAAFSCFFFLGCLLLKVFFLRSLVRHVMKFVLAWVLGSRNLLIAGLPHLLCSVSCFLLLNILVSFIIWDCVQKSGCCLI